MDQYNSIVAALTRKQLLQEGSSIALSHFHPLAVSPAVFLLSRLFMLFFLFHFPSSLLLILISLKTSRIPRNCPAQAKYLYTSQLKRLLQPRRTSGPTLLCRHQQLPGVFITVMTLLSGRRPLCCHRSTQANGGAILMMMLCPTPSFFLSSTSSSFFFLHTVMLTLLVVFHNKQLLEPSDASYKSVTLLPDLFSFTHLLTLTQTQSHTRRHGGFVYLSHFCYRSKFY